METLTEIGPFLGAGGGVGLVLALGVALSRLASALSTGAQTLLAEWRAWRKEEREATLAQATLFSNRINHLEGIIIEQNKLIASLSERVSRLQRALNRAAKRYGLDPAELEEESEV